MNIKLSFLITALLFACYVKAQNTITVDNSVGANAQYSDLQSAISAASNGDIIYVHASEINYGDITIDKSLSLIGFSHGDTDKKTLIDEITLLDNASNTRISGFFITNDLNANNNTVELNNIIIENNFFEDGIIYSGDAYAGINQMIIRGNILYGIATSTSIWSNFKNTIISNNIIRRWIYIKFHESVTIKNNIFLGRYYPVNQDSITGDLEVQNCIFYESSSSLVNIDSSGVLYQNCLTYNIGSGSYNTINGTNNLNNQNPNFVSADDASYDSTDDYNLQAGSPAIGNGVGGVDIGIYDGSAFTFNNFGYTNGIPTVKITDITDRIAPGANLSVTISTNAN
ncbi:hypothetical protein [Algibacter aquimarinus]|uniref:Right handed beta helix domain-containing protein n=1 Tax=Algibacter aquimarinus TaxID=1136748 RepID=A0ABP9HK97_9FLAO